ncbi:MAG: nucleoside hydrolase [Bacteroidales bacterium]
MKFLTLLLSLLCTLNGISQQKLQLIIDTDCALDDLRAISLVLSENKFQVNGIIASYGTLTPEDGKKKIKSLLHEFSKDSIPVACGDNIPNVNPPWREINKKTWWGDVVENQKNYDNSIGLFKKLLIASNQKYTIVCLSNLKSVADLIKSNPELVSKIERIIWYNDGYKPLSGFNYECDKKSADMVLESKIKVDIVSNLDNRAAIFDLELLNTAVNSKTIYSQVIAKSHSAPEVLELIKSQHTKIWDELTVIYLLYPEIFDMNPNLKNIYTSYCISFNARIVREIYKDLLTGDYIDEKNIVFNQFPNKKEMYMYDVREIMDSTIARYGRDEWKACVMTDEFHGHLGIFSIVGAKMGIFAREYFGVGVDKLQIISCAGAIPPYSCLNDGLQVSTGATLGQGTISLTTDSIRLPQAIFIYKTKKVKIKLKEEYLRMADNDINEGLMKYGILDYGYWKLVRKNALNYWLNWDRNKIFDLEILN